MTNNTTETLRYSDADLAEFKTIIETKIGAEQKDLKLANADLVDFTDNHADEDDEFTGERNTIQERIKNATQSIKGYESALVRIKQKTYGVCTASGKLIDKRRLLAMPTAMQAIRAENVVKVAK